MTKEARTARDHLIGSGVNAGDVPSEAEINDAPDGTERKGSHDGKERYLKKDDDNTIAAKAEKQGRGKNIFGL